jgi:tRNA threonylcarbamoyladenosine biosynthesis protein TsaE
MTVDSSSEPETTNQKTETLFGEFTTHSPEETLALGRCIGEQLAGGEIFLLRGDLGAGKTVLVKGLASGLGIEPDDVTSPSFTLVNAHEGRWRLYHIDLYRLDFGSQENLGLPEIFADGNAVTAIEWAERLNVVPAGAIDIAMSYVSDCERGIRIKKTG